MGRSVRRSGARNADTTLGARFMGAQRWQGWEGLFYLTGVGGGGVGMSSLLSGQLVIPRKCSQEINNGYF